MKTKICLVSLFTLLLTFAMYQGWLVDTQAAPTGLNSWTQIYATTAFPNNANYTLTVPNGNNRMLVVAIASTRTTAGAVTITTPTYGTKPMTLAAGDAATTTNWNHTAIYYLKETDIAGASNNTLNLTISGGTASGQYAYYRVYQNVDQNVTYGTGNGSARAFTSATANSTVGPFNPTLTINADDQAFEIVNLSRSATGTTARSIGTWASGWTTAGIGPMVNTSSPTTNMYIRDRAVPTSLTNDGSQHSAGSASTWDSMTAMSLKAAPTTTTLTVNGNTVIATGSKLDSDTGVVMQRVTVTGSGQLELNSLTMDDAGTATNIAAADVYIATAAQTTLPVGAVLLGSLSSWGGASTQISLTGGAQADRTLGGTQPLTKYLYIVYDMSPGEATRTVQSHITAVGVVAPNTGASGLNLSSNSITLTRSGNLLLTTANTAVAAAAKDSDAAVVMQHFKVDSDVFADNALELNSLTLQDLGTAYGIDGVKIYIDATESATLPATAALIGVQGEWVKAILGDTVVIPLNDDYGATSMDRTIIAGTSKYIYVVYSMRYEDTFTPGLTVQAKVTDVGVASPDSGVTGLSYLSNIITLTRGTWSKITTCGGCHDTANIFDGTARNVPDGKFIGSHRKHTNDYGKDCIDCHAKPALTSFNHANGYLNLTSVRTSGGIYDVGSNYSKGRAFKISNTPSMGTCSNLYCHSTGASEATGVLAGTTTTPTWGATLACSGCHGAPPAYSNNSPKKNTHMAGGHNLACDRCHYLVTTNGTAITSVTNHNNHAYNVNPNPAYSGTINFTYSYATDGGTCSSNLCHTDVKWGGSLPCTGCHAQEVNISTGPLAGQKRRAVATEFTLTWSHKRSGGRVATKEDCIVCHMEGDAASGGTSLMHKNGIIELRDPDTGTTIKQVTFSTTAGTGTTAGAFSSTAADATFTRFSQNLGVRPESDTNWGVLAAIQINQCLKCHDANGAASSLARVPGGTALKPFNTTITGHTTPYDPNGVGNVVNVDKSFNTTNASYHPVKGRGNNSFVKNAKMKAPYTLATDKSGTNTTSYGLLITCWDCHAPLNATGIQTASVTAHGGAVTLRRNIRTAGTAANLNLCIVCHAINYATVSNNHGSGSAFGSGGSSMNGTSTFANCHYCHAYLISNGSVSSGPTSSTRPLRGEDAHGFNDRFPQTVGSKWPAGNRPYSFIRNGLTGWRPANASAESLTGTSGVCGGQSGTCNNNMGGDTYAPGGSY